METVEHVIVVFILGSYRILVGLSFSCVCTVAACGNLIGLGGYSVADDGGVKNEGGTGNVAGGRVEGGSAGENQPGEGGTSGISGADNGAAGASGSEEASGAGGDSGSGGTSASGGTGGSASGSGGTSGSAGSGGAACPSSCDDANDCTIDSCLSGACVHQPLALGAACGVARSCDAQAVCVRCRDTAAGTAQDAGCSTAAPICLGTGLDAACAGCTTPADCNDGNECTSEGCTAGKCVFAAVAAGSACATGVCNGTAAAEKCVACADTGAGVTQDAGCSSAKPLCDPSGAPTCYQCLTDSDCATDNVSCTVATCTNHVCSQVATDSLCASSNDVCKPNKCDVTADCKQVDISAQKVLIGIGSTQGNGGFEDASATVAAGWADFGGYRIVYNCNGGCTASNGSTVPAMGSGAFVAWLGGTASASTTGTDHLIVLPLGTVRLQIIADINFQTKGAAAGNKDFFEVRLLNSAKVQVGTALYKASNSNAQTGSARAWTKDGINVITDVAAYAAAHVGEDSYLSLWSSVDMSVTTDFFIDNVRLTATVCQ